MCPSAAPEGDRDRLDGVIDCRHDLGSKLAEIDLVTEPAGERGHGPIGIVPSPVEAPIDPCLDPSPERLEERGDDEGRSAGLLTIDPPSAIESARSLVDFALASPDDDGRRQLLEAAERIARVSGEGELTNQAKRARAESLAALAQRTVGLQRLHWLREAIALFQQLGDAATLDGLRRQYEQGGQEALGELQTLAGTVVLERNEIEAMVNRMKLADGPSLVGYMSLPVELGLWIDPDDLREERRDDPLRTPECGIEPDP